MEEFVFNININFNTIISDKIIIYLLVLLGILFVMKSFYFSHRYISILLNWKK